MADEIDRVFDRRAVSVQSRTSRRPKCRRSSISACSTTAPSNTTRAPGLSLCPGWVSASQRCSLSESPVRNRAVASESGLSHPCDEQALDRAAARQPVAQQSRGSTARVVDDHKVTRKEEIRQRCNECVAEMTARAIEQQQTRAAALWSRILGDELGREIEIELADIHRVHGSADVRDTCSALNAGGLMDQVGAPDSLRLEPVFRGDRPQALIEILPIFQERSTQHALLYGADLPERSAATPVAQCSTRFESMRAEHFECEPQGEFCAVGEHARAPVFRGERETPFRGAESGLERPESETGR